MIDKKHTIAAIEALIKEYNTYINYNWKKWKIDLPEPTFGNAETCHLCNEKEAGPYNDCTLCVWTAPENILLTASCVNSREYSHLHFIKQTIRDSKGFCAWTTRVFDSEFNRQLRTSLYAMERRVQMYEGALKILRSKPFYRDSDGGVYKSSRVRTTEYLQGWVHFND